MAPLLSYEEQLAEYQRVNNSFKKKVIYHVGIDAGFHSEVDAMMECMLYCYLHKIKFTIYADDANWGGGRNGWNEFFESFCEENHDPLNKIGNFRYPINIHKFRYAILQFLLKIKNRASYLTVDIFTKCIPRQYSQTIMINWPAFDIDGSIFTQFTKLRDIALRFNENTRYEVEERIKSLNLPPKYASIQFRGGDKIMEFDRLVDVDSVLEQIDQNEIIIDNLFVFSDDYRYVKELHEKRPEWKIYTLTNENETGYVNAEFNKMDWNKKKDKMINLFAMIEICMRSSLHLGNEQTCVNNYIKYSRNEDTYFAIVNNSRVN